MAGVRRRSGRRSSISVRRKFAWARLSDDITTGTPATTGAVDLLEDFRGTLGTAANLPGFTVVRIRGFVQAEFATTPDLGHTTGIFHGIYVDGQASVAALPTAQPYEDWMFYEWWPVSITDSKGTTNTDRIVSRQVDNKSMRKLDEIQQTLFYVYQTTGVIAAEVFINLDIGMKLP